MTHSLYRAHEDTVAYHGEIWTDARGFATVRLPAEAGSLEPPLEYELRDLEPPSSARITAGLDAGRFTIATEQPHVKVAWRIKGRRRSVHQSDREQKEEMKKILSVTTVAVAIALGALAAATESAHATYPGDNGRLAFGINIGGNVDVYSVRPDGQDLRRLTDDPGFDACAAYSADGNRIAYCSGEGGGPVQVWTMRQNGTDKQQVTNMGGPAIFPKFSPDGRTIAFSAKPAGATTRNVYVVGSDGGTPQQLTSVGNNTYAEFSPDGSKIVFNSDRSGTWQVWVMDANGANQTQLTFDPLPKDQIADWSPDGTKIAFLADTASAPDKGGSGDIWVMNASGANPQPITSGGHFIGTAWSPDGTRIATLDFPSRTVYTLNATDGSDPQAVHPGGVQFVPGWQPRGNDQGENDDNQNDG